MPLERLVEIMRRLRDPKTGCEWDSVQTFETIAPYTIEEAYEVADAIARKDMDGLADELGDLQLQVVFHAQIAEDSGLFTLDDVITRICDKMERRHPHIFGEAEHGGHHLWEIIKAEERAKDPDKSALAGVALALPALERLVFVITVCERYSDHDCALLLACTQEEVITTRIQALKHLCGSKKLASKCCGKPIAIGA